MFISDHEEVGEFVYKRRKLLGWSRMRLAAKAGIHYSTIEKLESGASARFDTILKLIHSLGYEVRLVDADRARLIRERELQLIKQEEADLAPASIFDSGTIVG